MSPAQRSRTLTRPQSQFGSDVTDWRERAACFEADPELFFEPNGRERDDDKAARIEAARALCEECPVVAQCLTDAIRTGDRDAIRGGLTPHERDLKVRRDRRGAVVHLPKPPSDRDRAIALAKHGLTAVQVAQRLGLQERSVARYIKRARADGLLPRPARQALTPPTADARCGTYAGWQAHGRRGEEKCDPCKAAATKYDRDRKAKAKEVAA